MSKRTFNTKRLSMWELCGILAMLLAGGSILSPLASAGEPVVKQEGPVRKIVLLPPGPGNPRNSEGDFIRLNDGRILFIYTHFYGGGGDHSAAYLAGRYSADGGKTWTAEDVKVIDNEGDWNIMSVSLLRLQNGNIALFYMLKNSETDTRPVMRISTDEAETWSEPVRIIPEEHMGYYVLNNDRVVQLKRGRLVVPVSRHSDPGAGEKWTGYGRQTCYLSDDNGASWRRCQSVLSGDRDEGGRVVLQEPGVVELKDGRLMMWCRTQSERQYVSYSEDQGETWSRMEPSDIMSPCSPASIERIPGTGDLLLVWNNHRDIDPALKGKRTPFNVAISKDEGKTWQNVKTLEDDPHGWYCYTAVAFVDDHVLLGHCAGDRRKGGLSLTQITRFPVDWLYR